MAEPEWGSLIQQARKEDIVLLDNWAARDLAVLDEVWPDLGRVHLEGRELDFTTLNKINEARKALRGE